MLSRQIFTTLSLISALIASPQLAAQSPDIHVESLKSLVVDGATSKEKQIPILLVFVAYDCPFCDRVEEEFLIPMLLSGDYTDRVMIRHVHIGDGGDDVIDHNGKSLSPEKLQDRYDVFVTPTLVFIGPDGKEVGKRLTGINTVDYYGAYLDQSIDEGIEAIKASQKNRLQ